MKAFSAHMVNRFIDRMVIHLRATFPVETQNLRDTDLRKMIEAGIARAESHDVTDEVDVERFLECVVRHGPDFDTAGSTSWAGQILRDSSLTGTEKMNGINDYELFVLTLRP